MNEAMKNILAGVWGGIVLSGCVAALVLLWVGIGVEPQQNETRIVRVTQAFDAGAAYGAMAQVTLQNHGATNITLAAVTQLAHRMAEEAEIRAVQQPDPVPEKKAWWRR